MRNDISMFYVELIVASVCRCNCTGCVPIFTTSVSSKERKTVSNTDFTISHMAVLVMAVLDFQYGRFRLVGGRFGHGHFGLWPFWM